MNIVIRHRQHDDFQPRTLSIRLLVMIENSNAWPRKELLGRISGQDEVAHLDEGFSRHVRIFENWQKRPNENLANDQHAICAHH